VTVEELRALRKIGTSSPRSGACPRKEPRRGRPLRVHYKVGDHRGFTYTIIRSDERELLRAFAAAKQLVRLRDRHDSRARAGKLEASSRRLPAVLATRPIDAGADEFIGTASPRSARRGVPRKPIFYSLATSSFNSICSNRSRTTCTSSTDGRATATDAEFNAMGTG